MSRTDTWMPLYIGDYLADTMSLEAREHGAYLLLIMHYWRNGPLPDDDRSLAGIARVDRKTWCADTGPIIRAFFTPADGKLHHKRIDAERQSAQELADKRRAAAEARWGSGKKQKQAKDGSGGEQLDSKSDASADANASPVDDVCTSPYAGAAPSPSHSSLRSEKSDASHPPARARPQREQPPEIPTWVPIEPWNAWLTMRRQKRAPATAEAMRLSIRELERFREAGHDPEAVLNQSIQRGWTGLFEVKGEARNGGRFAAWDRVAEHLELMENHTGGRA
jgi:uncharacterized protein YdaU (DUF1376 family)